MAVTPLPKPQGCPHCGGTLRWETDLGVTYQVCFQCARRFHHSMGPALPMKGQGQGYRLGYYGPKGKETCG